MPRSDDKSFEYRLNFYFIIILLLTLIVPVFVLPYIVDDAFISPKNLLLLSGVLLMSALYISNILIGNTVQIPPANTITILLILIALNFISFLYTENYYYTIKAVVINVTCLLLFFFISISMDDKNPLFLIIAIAISGIIVSFFTWLQFSGIYLLIKWAESDNMIMGTIGNSNFLGAYLVFPLYAIIGIIFLSKGLIRKIAMMFSIFIAGAFLFARARAGWLGFFLAFPFFLFLMIWIHGASLSEFIKHRKKTILIYSILFLLLGTLSLSVFPNRFRNLLDYRGITNPKTLMLRMSKYLPPSYWLFKQSPLFGTGLWSYRSMVYKAQAEINRIDPLYFQNYPSPKPRRVHNEYMEILNDGGIIAALVLIVFLSIVMGHGWIVLKDKGSDKTDRVITAICLSSIIAIMITSFFFFTFRLNTTMFMTVLMMGIMEGIYIKKRGTIIKGSILGPEYGPFLIPVILLMLISILWYAGIKPFMGEMEHFEYKVSLAKNEVKTAEKHILKAIKYDAHNSAYYLYAAELYQFELQEYSKASDFVEKAIADFNGDIALYSAYFLKGLIKFRIGSLFEARDAFEKSLYYNPTFINAEKKLVETNKIINEHDSITINIRKQHN